MNISIHFIKLKQCTTKGKLPDGRIYFNRHICWDKTFTSEIDDDSILELALGYMYTLVLLRPHGYEIIFTYNGVRYRHKDFIKHPEMRRRLIKKKAKPPKAMELFTDYLIRINITNPLMEYIMVVSKYNNEDAPVDIIQFNNLTFLQSFISVLSSFGLATITHLYAIYDIHGISYNIEK